MTRFVLHFVSTFAFAAAIGSPSVALASSRIVADDVLARASAAAAHGRVVAVESSWDPAVGTIYTYVTLDVLQSWQLSGSPSRIVVKQLGGVVNDTALVVGGQAHFEVGEEVLLFLDVRPRDRTLSVAGLEQGKWTLTGSTDAATAMAREVRGTDPGRVVSRDFTSMAQLQALAALTGGRAAAAGVNLAPRASTAEEGRVGAAFTLLTPATPARWHQADSGAPVYVDTQSGGHPQFGGGGLTQLARAAQMWATAGSLPLQEGGSRGPRCFNNNEPSDGRISLTYGDPCGEIADESWTLAIGGAYYSSSEVRTVNGVSYWQITKGMIVTDNSPWKFSGMSTGCYEELVAHELGHTIGFGHASERPSLMYPAITSDCGSRSRSIPLSSDDLSGMAAVYPIGAANDPPPNSPTGLGTTISGSTVTIRWTPPVGGTPPQGYILYAGSAPGLSNIGSAATTSPDAGGAGGARRRLLHSCRRGERRRLERPDGGLHGERQHRTARGAAERDRIGGRQWQRADHVAAIGHRWRAERLLRARRLHTGRHDVPAAGDDAVARRGPRAAGHLLRAHRGGERRRRQCAVHRADARRAVTARTPAGPWYH